MGRLYIIPKREIEFAAKSGFLTKTIWMEFFNSSRRSWANDRWVGFKSRGLFTKHSSPLLSNCLVLNKSSPHIQGIISEDVSSPPLATQVYHDELVARIILKLLSYDLIAETYYLEPEIRRIQQDDQRDQKRKGHIKFPDAVFDLKTGSQLLRVALEVEISRKSQERYKRIIKSYSTSTKIEKIIIVHFGNRIRSSFEKAISKYGHLYSIRPMFFVDLDRLFSGDYFLNFFRNSILKDKGYYFE